MTKKEAEEHLHYVIGLLSGHGCCARVALVGSTFIESSGNDADILVYLGNPRDSMLFKDVLLDDEGFGYGGSENGTEDWASYKKETSNGPINVLIVEDIDYFDKWLLAAAVSQRVYEETNKVSATARSVRIAIHDQIMDQPEPKYISV